MDFKEFQTHVGKRIRTLRKEAGLKQEDLDEWGIDGEGIPVRTLQDIEAGVSNTTLLSLFKIANRLNVKPKDLLDV